MPRENQGDRIISKGRLQPSSLESPFLLSHPQQVEIHKTSCHFYRLSLLTTSIKEFLFFRSKQRLKSILLIKRDNLWCIDCINDNKAAARLVVMRHKPTLDKIYNLTSDTFSTKILIYPQSAYQNSRITAKRLLVMSKTLHIVFTASWQIVNTNAIIRNRKGTNNLDRIIYLAKAIRLPHQVISITCCIILEEIIQIFIATREWLTGG